MDNKIAKIERMAAIGDPEAQKMLELEKHRQGDGFRSMKLDVDGENIYESTFDLMTGTITRKHLIGELDQYDYGWGRMKHNWKKFFGDSFEKEWSEKYADTYENSDGKTRYNLRRKRAFSPVPETVDVAINTYCSFGCSFCYMDATKKGKHMSLETFKIIIEGFDEPPYQMAFGGGSPTHHPQFVEVLKMTREMGIIPNYTTEGDNLTDEILEATNKYCGGVALTAHLWKGKDHFVNAYNKLKNYLPYKQINVHVIADKDIVKTLDAINDLDLGPMNLVLLAYYPDVGRSNIMSIMDKKIYMKELPEAIQRCMDKGHRIAMSEGMLPYFLSRPEIGVNMKMATPMEGFYSCYFDVNGRISESSFSPPYYPEEDKDSSPEDLSDSAVNTPSQLLWERHVYFYGDKPSGGNCENCQFSNQCSTPSEHHYYACKFAEHNEPESQPKIKSNNYRNNYAKEPAYQLTVTSGFITNSSSVIYHFDARILEHPKVKRFLEAYELNKGYVGSEIWNREDCMTLAMTKEQKEEAHRGFNSINGWDIFKDDDSFRYNPDDYIDVNNSGPIIIYGDEYDHITHTVCELMRQASEELGLNFGGRDYN